MSWPSILLAAALGLLVAMLGLYAWSRWLEKREPYASFMRLPVQRQLRVFRLLATDPRVPRRVKVLPILLVGYLASPLT
jgi:hypothetical protein